MTDNLTSSSKVEVFFWFLSLCIGLGVGVFLQEYGLTATPDSIEYMDAAIGFLDLKIDLLPVWGPFYPLVLSVFSIVRLPAEAACFVNGIAFALLITSSMRIAHFLRIPWYGLVLVGLIPVMWTDIWHVYQVIWSEGTFIALVCLHFVYLQKYLHNPKISNWFVAILMASLALSTQYMGYFLLPHLMFILWFYRRKRDVSQHLLTTIIAYVPHFLWLAQNFVRSETLHGERHPSPYTLSENFERFLRITMESFGTGLGIIIFAVVTLFLWQNPKQKLKTNPSKSLLVYSLISSLFFFSTLLLYSTSTVAINQVNARLSAPIYPMVFLLSLFGASHVWLLLRKPQHFTTITCLGIMIFTITLGKQIGSPERDSLKWINSYEKRRQESFLPFLGINKTSTIVNLQKMLLSEFEGKDHINILWLEKPKFNKYFKLLLFREILQTESFRIGKLHSQASRIQGSLETSYGLKLLSVHNTGTLKNLEALEKRIEHIFNMTGDQHILVVGRKPLFKNVYAPEFSWERDSGSVTRLIQCKPEHQPVPYMILECEVSYIEQISVEPEEIQAPPTQEDYVTTVVTSPSDASQFAGLEISEIMVYPQQVKKWRGEWFEVHNNSARALNLNGLEFLSKEDKGFSVVKDLILAPNEYGLFAMRKSPSLNGGLPDPDYIYTKTDLSIQTKDWVEIRYQNQVIDRIEVNGEMIEHGASLIRVDGQFCVGQSTYGLGDKGTPKAPNHCP